MMFSATFIDFSLILQQWKSATLGVVATQCLLVTLQLNVGPTTPKVSCILVLTTSMGWVTRAAAAAHTWGTMGSWLMAVDPKGLATNNTGKTSTIIS